MKFYISYIKSGNKRKHVVAAGNIYHACIKVYKKFFIKDEILETLPTYFRVSHRGFDDHEDDEIIGMDEILNLLLMCYKNEI